MRALELFLIEILVASTVLCAEDTSKNDIIGRCKLPLGMEEGKIPDDAITASSSYEIKSVGPQNARIRQEKNGGAWCPKAQISSDIREYLEVDLTRDHLITWTETQGRFGNGQGQEYAESFFLEYWRDSQWHPYKTLRGDRILRGNSNTYLVVQQKLDLPFVASRVRFVPYSQHPRTVCMRVEIFGCVWDQGIRRYKAPKGQVFGPEGANAEDYSYDGTEEGDYLTGGLGQLTDGVIGEDPYRFESSSSTNWVGWSDLNPVEIIFEFSGIREFENCTMHVANAPDKGVEPFSRIRAWFSRDGKTYEPNEEKAEFIGSIRTSLAVLSMDLHSRTGRFVRLELVPSSKWLLISEISFQTVAVAGGNVSTEPRPEIGPAGPPSSAANETVDASFDEERSETSSNETLYEINPNVTPDAFPVNNSQTYIGLVSGALMVLALSLACTFFLVKLRGRNKVALLQKHTALLCGSPAPGITINMKDIRLSSSKAMANGPGGGVSSLSRPSIKSKCPSSSSGDCATIGSLGNHSANEYEHCSVYEKTYKLFSEENLAYEQHTCKRSNYSDVTGFSSEGNLQDDRACSDRIVQTPFPTKRRGSMTQTTKSSSKVHEGYYAATDILTIKRREQHAGSSLFTSLHIDECAHLADAPNSYKVQEISRHRLRILDKIGEGSFGFVHLCEAKGIQSPDLGTTRNRQVVIVRSLWRGVTDSLKKVFMKDMYALAEIRDINIARIIALVEEEPFGAVFEYGELGDLPSFVREHEKSNNDTRLSYGCLLNFATQIASGMKYLEGLKVPHCDLAARNCVVNKNLVIKVSDHAMYCSKYENEYYVNECYAKIPLRWMAWEAVLLGKRSCQADVWSYATTVWEIMTHCEEMPFSDMTSEQVLENCGKWYQGSASVGGGGIEAKNQPRILQQPTFCSRDLYRMMTKCWSKRAEERPSFDEIHLFLKRLGFD